jgi:putative PIN family toxin of toxin-antitoxin system
MKVIVDTNVLVSAVLKDKDPEAVILFIVERSEFEWIVSAAILEEYKEVLGREKFGLPVDVLRKWNEVLDVLTTVVEVDVAVDFPRDRKDAKFLECALAADVEYLITGDKDFSEAQKIVDTTIISVSMFRKFIIES